MRRRKPIQIPKDPGQSGWLAIAPKRHSAPMLKEDIECDYAVIGAGFAGLSAARRLQQVEPNANIVILEAKGIAEGPAGRNSGFMVDLPHNLSSDSYIGDSANKDQIETVINRTAISFAREASDEYQMVADALRPIGKINAASNEKGLAHNEEYASHLKNIGEPFEMRSAEEMRALTGIEYYIGGIWTPGAAMLQPASYIQGLADGVAQHSSTFLFENSPVTCLKRENDHWYVKSEHGSVRAQKVILAVNGVVERFGYFKRRLMHIFTYASMTRPLNGDEVNALGGADNWGFTPSDPMGSTVRRIFSNNQHRIVVRNRFTYDPKLEVPNSRIYAVSKDHDKAFKARFPMLNNVQMEYRWGGRLCLSLNDVWAVEEVEENLITACCQNGLGTAKGTAAGIMAAEMASMCTQPLITRPQEAMPSKLYPEPFMWLGANGVIRYKEWRAGSDF